MMDERPDPDRLLAAARRSEAPPTGRLKIWLGAAAGVGKTCAMLDAAREARGAGRDLVVGVVEHHGRPDTLARLGGLPVVPLRRGPPGHPDDLDLDAVLARRPEVVIVDELAHTNAPGGRHPKRWQDVLELVDQGIEVWTAVNVQHLERTSDVVGRLTGVSVRETVPDSVLERADEIEVVDLPPDELLARLRAGKVYAPDATRRALAGFFQRGNLLALRELALRRAAERVRAQVDDFRDAEATPEVWSPTDRLLVAVGPSPTSADLVRAASRLARALDAPFHAVLVRTSAMSAAELARAHAHLALAEALGGRAATLEEDDVPVALIRYAREHNLRTLVLGANPAGRIGRWLRPSLLDVVARNATDLEVHVVPTRRAAEVRRGRRRREEPWTYRDLALAVGLLVAATGLGWLLRDILPEADLLMLYLVAVVLAAFRLPRVASLVTALGAVAAFNFFFTEPRFTFYVTERRYLLTFAGLGALGVLVSVLATRARERARVAARRENEARALFHLGRALTAATDPEAVAGAAVRHATELLGTGARFSTEGAEGPTLIAASTNAQPEAAELATVRWVLARGLPAGPGTDTLPSGRWLHLPLLDGRRALAVLSVEVHGADLDDPDRRHLLDTLVAQAAAALAREAASRAGAREAERADREKARSDLLASVSHDLRTPLATITGAATALRESPDLPGRLRLLDEVVSEAARMDRLVQNLLHITRLEDRVAPRCEWLVAQEVAGSAVARLRNAAGPLRVVAPESPVWVYADPVLVEQALVNLLENAGRHGAGSEPAEVRVIAGDPVRFWVQDRGPGVPASQAEYVFGRFARGPTAAAGAGLGLAVVRAVARVHGGEATVEAREGGGARFVVTLPAGGPEGLPWPDDLEAR